MDDAVDALEHRVEGAARDQVGARGLQAGLREFLLQRLDQAGRGAAAEVQPQVVLACHQQAAGDLLAEETAGAGEEDLHARASVAEVEFFGSAMQASTPSTIWSMTRHTRRICSGGTGSAPRPSTAS